MSFKVKRDLYLGRRLTYIIVASLFCWLSFNNLKEYEFFRAVAFGVSIGIIAGGLNLIIFKPRNRIVPIPGWYFYPIAISIIVIPLFIFSKHLLSGVSTALSLITWLYTLKSSRYFRI